MKTHSGWKSSAIAGLFTAALSLAGCQEEISSKGTPEIKVYTTIEAPGLERRWVQPNGPKNVVPILISEGTWNGNKWRLYDTGMRVRKKLTNSIYWVDDENLIFNGEWAEPGQRAKVGHYGVILWNMRDGVSLYREDGTVNCAAEGKVRILIDRNFDPVTKIQSGTYLYGPQESPGKVSFSYDMDAYQKGSGWRRSEADCVVQAVPNQYRDGAKKDRTYVPLHVNHGYMDFGPNRVWYADQADFRYIYHSYSNGKDYPLPIPYNAINKNCIRYYPHKDAYLLKDCGDLEKVVRNSIFNNVTVPKCANVWWLFPDGRTEKACVETHYMAVLINKGKRVFQRIFHTKNGFMFTLVGKDPDGSGLDEKGLYWDGLSADHAFLLGSISAGREFQLDVSPNGCQLAFAFGPNDRANRNGIMILDVCVEDPLPDSVWEIEH